MLYQRYMIYRVRSNCHLSHSTQKRRQRTRIAILALPLMALCATGIYGSFQDSNPEQSVSVPPPAPSKVQAFASPKIEFGAEARVQLPESPATERVTLDFHAVQVQVPSKSETAPSAPILESSTSDLQPPAIESAPELTASAERPSVPADSQTAEAAPVIAEAVASGTAPKPEVPSAVTAVQPGMAPEPAVAPAGDPLLKAVIDQIAVAPEAPEDSDEASLVDDDNIGSRWVETKVQSGDNLPKIFARLNLPTPLLHEIVDSGKAGKELTNLRPGETFRALLDAQHQIQELVYRRDALTSIQVTPDGDGFKVRKIDKPTTVQKTQVTGTITNSLYESAKKAGLSDRMILDMAQIFGWDIDFALEIQPGDRFTVIYDEELVDGEKFRNGPILAAEFVNDGKIYRAFRFEEGDGHANYYNAEGKGMRKAFLRAPLDFLRVTSRFSKERFHPVLGVKRPHKGVDYGAPTGTPVYAAGDGKVEFAGSKNGYGNTVILQHGDGRSTLYGHLSKINGKVTGSGRVKQGQVIGYVGATGLASGPHLHYEFRVNGEHRNPENIKLPNNVALEKAQKEKFRKSTANFVAQLDKIAKTQVAEANLGQTRIQ